MVFSQFRSQYPQGSIITEMLSKVDGMHTFRAVIKDQEQILSTATAVDADFEAAEDRAITRALTILGLSYGMQATLMPQPVLRKAPDFLEPAPENYPEPVKPKKFELPSEPIDLSSQLSQIIVEMERIGWSKQQGKEYLQRKYKKSSRDQLSASEVFDFLQYLQAQSDTF